MVSMFGWHCLPFKRQMLNVTYLELLAVFFWRVNMLPYRSRLEWTLSYLGCVAQTWTVRRYGAYSSMQHECHDGSIWY